MRTLIQLTTISMLAACLQSNIVGIAVAPGVVSNSTSHSKSNSTAALSTSTDSDTSWFGKYAAYEPDANGNPTSDGTGTR